MITPEIEEGSTGTLIVSFFSKEDPDAVPLPLPEAPVTPESATYTIHDVTDEENIVTITPSTPITGLDETVTLTITPTENRILDTTNRYEARIVTVSWEWSGGTQKKNSEYRYLVKNLHGVI